MTDHEHYRLIKRLTIALAISGSLNILFFAFGGYFIVRERPPIPYFELKPAVEELQQSPLAVDYGNAEAIRMLRTLTLEQLIIRLSSCQLVENGYTERDLALACMTTFHYLDIKRALKGQPQALQKRKAFYGRLANGNPAELTVYPGLTDKQWQSILQFVYTERWPQTPQGLFSLLKKQGSSYDTTLVDSFAMGAEFHAMEALFGRSKYSVQRLELLQLILEGDWQTLSEFESKQRVLQDLSDARRQQLLLDYTQKGSKSAAFLLLKTDFAFSVKKLDDANVLNLLLLLEEKSPDSEKYALALLTSPRSDAVWKMAATRLYQYAGEERPQSFRLQDALMRFVPTAQKRSVRGIEKPQVIPETKKIADVQAKPVKVTPFPVKDRIYLVQEGDNLWKISRRFNIDINLLKKHNGLTSDLLTPGLALRIPVSRGR